jgi:alkylhydroperoxidase family enzyme
MPRYQLQDETKLDDAQRRIFNECKAGPRGSVPPPVHVWLRSPGLADHAHKLGAHVRFGTDFTPKQTEIAILMTARYWTAQFEWAAHVRLALQAGLTQDAIDAIAARRTPISAIPTTSSSTISAATTTTTTASTTRPMSASSSAGATRASSISPVSSATIRLSR